jgi:protein tyrosine/serine phosphatase
MVWLCAVVLVGGVLVVGYVYRQRNIYPTEVTAGVLYRSALPTNRQLAHLGDLNIKTIVNLCDPKEHEAREEPKAYQAEKQFCQDHGLEFVAIPITALLPTDEQVKQFLEVMANRHASGGAVLVHCAQGRNRTGMMVAAYRIVIEDWPGEKALKEMQDLGADRDGDKGAKKAQFVMAISKDRQKWRATSRPTTTPATNATLSAAQNLNDMPAAHSTAGVALLVPILTAVSSETFGDNE